MRPERAARPGTIALGDDLAATPIEELPLVLADLHRATPVDATVTFSFAAPDQRDRKLERCRRDVFEGAGFERPRRTFVDDDAALREQWSMRRAHTLADTVGAGLRLLLCGLNPSPYAADVGVGFARPGNRFWPAALEAGVVTVDRDPRHALVTHHVGMTDLVKRATARAEQVGAAEFRTGAARVRRLVEWLRPDVICFVGLMGYRLAVDSKAAAGAQSRRFGGVATYVMPNPSGLNAHVGVPELAEHLRAALALREV